MPDRRFPNRKAVCPECGKKVSAYVPSAVARFETVSYIFRAHSKPTGTPRYQCRGWGRRVPDDAFVDGKPNIDKPPRI